MNKATLMAVLMTVASIAGAVNEHGNKNFTGEVNFEGSVGIDSTKITATAAEINIMDGVGATTAELNLSSDISGQSRSLTVTNDQAITLLTTDKVIALTSQGQEDGYTNTVTIALPYPVGQEFMFRVVSGSTNLAELADATTTLSLGSNAILGATDTLKIYTAATNEAVKVSTGDN